MVVMNNNQNKQVPKKVPTQDQIPGQISAEEVLDGQENTPSTINVQKRYEKPASDKKTGTRSKKSQTGAEHTSQGSKSSKSKTGAKAGTRAGTKSRSGTKQTKSGTSGGKIVSINSKRRAGVKVGTKAGTQSGTSESGTEIIKSGAKSIGRPKGAKDKKPRKIRYDNSPMTAVALDDRARIVRHNLELFNLGTLRDRNDEVEVQERIQTYFEICAKNSVMPTVAGFAMSLGIDRATLWTWLDNRTGVIKNPVVLDVLKRIYSMMNTQYEELLTEGKIIPVGAFFLLQNNHGYKNQTDHVVVAQQAEEPDTNEIAARAGLLEDGAGDR